MKIQPPAIFAAALLAIFSHPVLAADTYKLTLWNQYNGGNNDRGTTACRIEALKDGKVVWKNEKFKLLWRANKDMKGTVSFALPPGSPGIDAIRITITEWIGEGGGLSEIEVYKDDKDITADCKVTVSAVFDGRYSAANLTDRITTSKTKDTGYWLLPDKSQGSIDIKLP